MNLLIALRPVATGFIHEETTHEMDEDVHGGIVIAVGLGFMVSIANSGGKETVEIDQK